MTPTAKKILIVDDGLELHKLLRIRLEYEGYSVEDAFNGDEALSLLTKTKPDAVIIDVLMPGMDGFEVCRRIKRESPRTKVIVYTAKMEGVDAGKAKEAGADLFTVKTNSFVLLLAAVERILAED